MKEDFKTELLGIYDKKECLERETELAMTSLFPKGLNGNAGRYVEITEEVREKMRYQKSKEHKAKMSAAMKGKSHSESTKAKMSAAMKGKSHTESTKARIREALKGDGNPRGMLGKTHSEEHKAKMSAAMKGKSHSESTKANISAAKKGKTVALNIETGIVSNIPRELYQSRRDIYFSNRSRAFQNWKANQA